MDFLFRMWMEVNLFRIKSNNFARRRRRDFHGHIAIEVLIGVPEMTPSARQTKRKERETKSTHLYERDEKYQYLVDEFEIRCSSDKSAKVWRYFGDLYHRGRIICDRVYCNPCLQIQREEIDVTNCYFGSLVPRIKHYAKSVSTGNLAIHLNDKHSITVSGSGTSPSRPAKLRRSK